MIPATKATPPVGGRSLGPVIGEGAHSLVHRTRLRERDVAVKVSRAPAATGTTALLFRMEATALARVNHPGFVEVYESGVGEDGRAYIVTELIQGQTLAERIARGALPEREALALAQRLAEALGALHRLGLVHRDIKPDNALLPSDGSGAKLVDLGLAFDPTGGQQRAVGTFLYSAPEQTGMLKLPVDGRADLYALGAVLYECLTAQTPFAATDLGELIRLHAVQPAPDVRSLAPDVSRGLSEVVARLLAKDPDDRYPRRRGAAPGPVAAARRRRRQGRGLRRVPL